MMTFFYPIGFVPAGVPSAVVIARIAAGSANRLTGSGGAAGGAGRLTGSGTAGSAGRLTGSWAAGRPAIAMSVPMVFSNGKTAGGAAGSAIIIAGTAAEKTVTAGIATARGAIGVNGIIGIDGIFGGRYFAFGSFFGAGSAVVRKDKASC